MSAGVRLLVLWLGATIVAVTVAIQAVGYASTQVVGPVPITIGLGAGVNATPTPDRAVDQSDRPVDGIVATSPDETGVSPSPRDVVRTVVVVDVTQPIASVSSIGGTATFRVLDGQANLLSASPNGGFAVEVTDGEASVDVRFVSPAHESRVRAVAEDGGRIEVEERARTAGEGSTDESEQTDAGDQAG